MASFGELLAQFKKNESPENIVPLLENATLRDALVAWKSVYINFKKAEDCPYEDQTRQWNWMWSQIKYDIGEYIIVSGVAPGDAPSILKRLIGLRLIYPDGTINEIAAQFLQSLIWSKLPRKRGRPPSKKPEK